MNRDAFEVLFMLLFVFLVIGPLSFRIPEFEKIKKKREMEKEAEQHRCNRNRELGEEGEK